MIEYFSEHRWIFAAAILIYLLALGYSVLSKEKRIGRLINKRYKTADDSTKAILNEIIQAREIHLAKVAAYTFLLIFSIKIFINAMIIPGESTTNLMISFVTNIISIIEGTESLSHFLSCRKKIKSYDKFRS